MHKIVAAAAGALFAPAAFATQVIFIPAAPTLSEFGLGALVVILAAVAGWVIRKRK